jgi:hypothetical protein
MQALRSRSQAEAVLSNDLIAVLLCHLDAADKKRLRGSCRAVRMVVDASVQELCMRRQGAEEVGVALAWRFPGLNTLTLSANKPCFRVLSAAPLFGLRVLSLHLEDKDEVSAVHLPAFRSCAWALRHALMLSPHALTTDSPCTCAPPGAAAPWER